MEIKIFQVDAFASKAFDGNPAAVCPLTEWLADDILLRIAEENNLSETAFIVRKDEHFELRWFTPKVEVDLCGHATLATAWVLFNELNEKSAMLRFATRSGELQVTRDGDLLAMDFPQKTPTQIEIPAGLSEALGLNCTIKALFQTDDYIVVLDDETVIEHIRPDFTKLAQFDIRGIAVTAQSKKYDFVSRWFGPRVGVNEDPVTGSAHTSLAPYWAEQLGKNVLNAQQGGNRKGQLCCEVLENGRVIISGNAVLFLRGTLYI